MKLQSSELDRVDYTCIAGWFLTKNSRAHLFESLRSAPRNFEFYVHFVALCVSATWIVSIDDEVNGIPGTKRIGVNRINAYYVASTKRTHQLFKIRELLFLIGEHRSTLIHKYDNEPRRGAWWFRAQSTSEREYDYEQDY